MLIFLLLTKIELVEIFHDTFSHVSRHYWSFLRTIFVPKKSINILSTSYQHDFRFVHYMLIVLIDCSGTKLSIKKLKKCREKNLECLEDILLFGDSDLKSQSG
jgi:hypothetical protein